MANNQTKRERRDMAKKERMEAQKRAARQRTQRRLYTLVAFAVAIGLVVFLVQQSGKKGREDLQSLNTLAASVGCGDVQNPPSEGRDHIQATDVRTYKTSPATSGPHAEPVDTGIHAAPVPEVNVIHNLEHGHVVLQYKEDVPAAVKKALEDLAKKDDTHVLVAPNPTMKPTIAFTAWTRLLACDQPAATYADAGKIGDLAGDFIKQFKNKAPEQVAGTPA